MAAILVGGSGNWDSVTPNAPWPSGTLPTNADDVTINNAAHTLTLKGLLAVCNSVTVTSGIFTPDLTAPNKLVIRGTSVISLSNAAASAANINFDVSSVPQFTTTIELNSGNTAANNGRINLAGQFTLKGAAKTRWTTTSTVNIIGDDGSVGKLITAVDATGWRQGDVIAFISTQAYNATPRVDLLTLAAGYTNGSTTLLFTAGLTYAHATGCVIGNMTSNLIVQPNTAGNEAYVRVSSNTSGSDCVITDVAFNSTKVGGQEGGLGVQGNCSALTTISNNAFYDYRNIALYLRLAGTKYTRNNNIFFSTAASSTAKSGQTGQADVGFETGAVIFRSPTGVILTNNGETLVDCIIGGVTDQAVLNSTSVATMTGGAIINSLYALGSAQGGAAGSFNVSGTQLGTKYPGAVNSVLVQTGGPSPVILTSCPLDLTGASLGAGGSYPISSAPDGAYVQLLNKGDGTASGVNPAVQEIYKNTSTTLPVFQLDAANANRATSSMKINFYGTANKEQTQTFSVLAKSGVAITMLCFVKKTTSYKSGAFTEPSVTVSGLGITPVVVSAGAGSDNAWELLTISATQTTGADGNLNVTFSGKSATNTAAVWFSGLPFAPFITRARHYGYLFDETISIRTPNITVSASEATAAAYTGMAVTWGASLSTTAVTLDNTFQKLYDYTQADACLNVGSAMPLTGAGVAGSPALFAAGAITVSATKTLNGSGSLAMGANILTGAVPWAYTYTGGTFSQAAAVPTFSGGTLGIGGTGTYTFVQAASTLVNVTPAGTGTYNFGSGTFTGTLTVRNLAAHAITVNVPTGTTTSSTGNVGGAITFSSPQVYQEVTVTGLAATARIQIYDVTASTQLYLGVPGTASHTWTDSSAAVGSRSIRLRIMRCVGTSADIIVDKLIGTCGTTEAAKAVSYLHDAVLDTAYNGNAFDGSTITGIAIIDGTMRLQISSGTIVAYGGVDTLVIDGRKAYAYETYWLSTDAGLVDESRFIIAVDGVNLRFVDFKIKNTTTGPVYPVIINNAYVVDDATGVSASLTDYTGGPIHYAPDHMISNVVTVGGVNIITGDIADVPARVQTGLTSQGYTAARATHLEEIAKIEGLSIADPVIIDNDAQTRVAGLISQTVIKVGNVTTIQRL